MQPRRGYGGSEQSSLGLLALFHEERKRNKRKAGVDAHFQCPEFMQVG